MGNMSAKPTLIYTAGSLLGGRMKRIGLAVLTIGLMAGSAGAQDAPEGSRRKKKS